MLSRIRRSLLRFTSITLTCIMAASLASANGPAVAESTATLPLEKVLEMQKKIDEATKEPDEAPPVGAAVHRIELAGRLLDEAIEFKARFDIDVLGHDTWVEIPLLKQDARTHILDLPQVPGGAFTVLDGTLRFITKTRKRYQFDLSILKEASKEGDRRSLELQLADASVSICKLRFDEDLFTLLNTRILAKPDGVLVLPTEDRFAIDWSVRESRAVQQAVEKPEIASVVQAAHVSSVSTLEGIWITRALYRLRFAGHKPIGFEIPAGHTVDRAYLNGFAVPVDVQDREFRIEAAPARAGDESATVELVMTADEGVFHLAGDIAIALPRVSWPTNEIFLSLHLPEVFTYEWKGGSLSPVTNSPTPPYTYQVPLPGKKMAFHQYLVTAHAPNVSLDYAVDLENQYFCAEPHGIAYTPVP